MSEFIFVPQDRVDLQASNFKLGKINVGAELPLRANVVLVGHNQLSLFVSLASLQFHEIDHRGNFVRVSNELSFRRARTRLLISVGAMQKDRRYNVEGRLNKVNWNAGSFNYMLDVNLGSSSKRDYKGVSETELALSKIGTFSGVLGVGLFRHAVLNGKDPKKDGDKRRLKIFRQEFGVAFRAALTPAILQYNATTGRSHGRSNLIVTKNIQWII